MRGFDSCYPWISYFKVRTLKTIFTKKRGLYPWKKSIHQLCHRASFTYKDLRNLTPKSKYRLSQVSNNKVVLKWSPFSKSPLRDHSSLKYELTQFLQYKTFVKYFNSFLQASSAEGVYLSRPQTTLQKVTNTPHSVELPNTDRYTISTAIVNPITSPEFLTNRTLYIPVESSLHFNSTISRFYHRSGGLSFFNRRWAYFNMTSLSRENFNSPLLTQAISKSHTLFYRTYLNLHTESFVGESLIFSKLKSASQIFSRGYIQDRSSTTTLSFGTGKLSTFLSRVKVPHFPGMNRPSTRVFSKMKVSVNKLLRDGIVRYYLHRTRMGTKRRRGLYARPSRMSSYTNQLTRNHRLLANFTLQTKVQRFKEIYRTDPNLTHTISDIRLLYNHPLSTNLRNRRFNWSVIKPIKPHSSNEKYSFNKTPLPSNSETFFNKPFSLGSTVNFKVMLFLYNNPLLFKYYMSQYVNYDYKKWSIFTQYFIKYNLPYSLTNIIPSKAFNWVFFKKAWSTASSWRFKPYLSPWYNINFIRFLENLTGLNVMLNFYPFMEFQVQESHRARYLYWLPRMAYYERKLGHRFFLEESIHLLHLGFLFKDASIIASWLKSMIKRISFWKTRLIFRFLKYLIITYYLPIFQDLGVKGLKLKLKGKISVAGNSRKRVMLYRFGLTSYSKVDLRVLHEAHTINTFTGVLGFQLWLFF